MGIRNVSVLAKIFVVALAVGLDVLAVSIGVGVTRFGYGARLRLGFAFASAEILMQVIGYELGSGAGALLGEFAAYAGFILLALIGAVMIRNSLRHASAVEFDPTRGAGLLVSSLSISLDSLGVGIALPSVGIPLAPLLIVVSVTTTAFTFVGFAFGARLGQRYERKSECAAGIILLALAALFSLEHFL
ncbi:MAG: manganese efflux pump MntP family protein [Candidatus Binataceae bacterium]